jgi:hypothetical protein
MFKLPTTIAIGMLFAVLLAPQSARTEGNPADAPVPAAHGLTASVVHQGARPPDTAALAEGTTASASVGSDADALIAHSGWATLPAATTLWTDPARAVSGPSLPAGALVEIVGGGPNGTVLVRFPGDGREHAPGRGWIDRRAVHRSEPPAELPRAYPSSTATNVVRVHVPYRSQRDGSSWAESNCGPTTLGMALAAFGVFKTSAELRAQVLDAQQMWGDDAGTLLDALAQVARDYGVDTVGVSTGGELNRWSVGEIREQLLQKRPVVVQVRFQALRGREHSSYLGDHYVLLTGVAGESFLYNDPFDSDGLGFDRLMSRTTLQDAMRTSDGRYTATAFALARR